MSKGWKIAIGILWGLFALEALIISIAENNCGMIYRQENGMVKTVCVCDRCQKESEVRCKSVFVPNDAVINGNITTIDGVQIVKKICAMTAVRN